MNSNPQVIHDLCVLTLRPLNPVFENKQEVRVTPVKRRNKVRDSETQEQSEHPDATLNLLCYTLTLVRSVTDRVSCTNSLWIQ